MDLHCVSQQRPELLFGPLELPERAVVLESYLPGLLRQRAAPADLR